LKTIGIVALAAVAALVLGFGARLGTQTAHAEADGSVAIGCEFLLRYIDGNPDDATDLTTDLPDACFDGIDAADVVDLANALGDEDDELEESDFEDADLDLNQVEDGLAAALCDAPLAATTNCRGEILLFAFVDNQTTVQFDAENGLDIVISDDGGAAEASPADDANGETCEGDDDEDCGSTVTNNGDGVVVATAIDNAVGDPGDSVEVDILQNDNTSDNFPQTIEITGGPDSVVLDVLKNPIQTSGDSTDVGDCEDESDIEDAAAQLGDVNRTVLKATVTDEDGTELTRVGVDFEVDDEDIASFDADTGEPANEEKAFTGVSVDGGAAGVGSFLILCGGTDTGTATVTATAGTEDDDAEVDVVGEPANVALTASPAAIDCDGAATTTVSATVTDADGNNVADGSNVNFSVVALGTASPINADTTAGVATSSITPLSGAVAGVTVIVTAGDAQASIRVDCNTPAAATATPGGPAPTPPGGGPIGGPDTGSGGYLSQDSSGVSMWTLVALALGSMVLVAGGMVTRRVGK